MQIKTKNGYVTHIGFKLFYANGMTENTLLILITALRDLIFWIYSLEVQNK